MQALQVSAADVSRQLKQVQVEAAGGRTDLGGAEQSVRLLATVRSAEELADTKSHSTMVAVSAWTRSLPSSTPSPSRARRQCSTANRWWASRCRVRRGQ